MPDKPVRILFTRSVGRGIIDRAARYSVHIDAIPFILTRPVAAPEPATLLRNLAATDILLFTSANAVKAVAPEPHRPPCRIFCLSGATLDSVRDRFPASDVLASAPDARSLADAILRHSDVARIQFFCGNLHLPLLPRVLGAAGIEVLEHVVYETILTPAAVGGHFDALAFFSPSAVESFLRLNAIPANAALFAIGHTTAAALTGQGGNLIISARPDPDAMLDAIIEFYQRGAVPNKIHDA